MKYIANNQISKLNINPIQTIEWVKEAFSLKGDSFLPHKISIGFEEAKFMNTMPAIVPKRNIMGCKIVTRYPNRTPSVDGQIYLYDYSSGDFKYLLDAFWITTARTGAVCALAIKTLAKKSFNTIAIMGLGNTAKASITCILEDNKDKMLKINLLKYKDQAEKFIEYFKGYNNVEFEIYTDVESLVKDSDVVISCITNTNKIIAEPAWFKKGTLLVPVHTKGFQTCDLVFDKIFADDKAHVEGFKYFNQYKNFAEIQDVISGKVEGRKNDSERIISYNIGIILHDLIFANHIIKIIEKLNIKTFEIENNLSNGEFYFHNVSVKKKNGGGFKRASLAA